jgi:hypothetical protein
MGASNDLVALVVGKPFGALIPEQDLPVSIHYGYPGLEAVQYGSKDLWILKLGHRAALEASI